jgi:lipopolysaccharide export system permease protein
LFLGILTRSIFFELAKVFLISLVAITGIIVLAAVVVEASQRGLGPAQIIVAIPLLVPSMMPFIIPPTTLFASCVVYGRLAHDNEIIAIKSAGINILHVVWPGAFLGLVMSLSTLGLYYYLIPHTHLMLRTAVTNDMKGLVYSMLKKDGQFRELVRGRGGVKTVYEIYVRGVQGQLLKNAIFKRRDRLKGDYDVVAKAREAELEFNMLTKEVSVTMRDGHVLDAKGASYYSYFQEQVWSIPLAPPEKYDQSSRDMTWQELLQARRDIKDEMNKSANEASVSVAQEALMTGAKNLSAQAQAAQYVQRNHKMRVYNLDTELHMRPALSFGCLFFVLVGCPVGIWFSRSDYLSAFITCFMPIVFIYYPIQLCCTNFSKDGKLHPAVALWAANTALGVIAMFLFRKLVKN